MEKSKKRKLVTQDYIFPSDFEIYNFIVTFQNVKNLTLKISAEEVKRLKHETKLTNVLFLELIKEEPVNIQKNDFTWPNLKLIKKENFLKGIATHFKPIFWFNNLVTAELGDPSKGLSAYLNSPLHDVATITKRTKNGYKRNVPLI